LDHSPDKLTKVRGIGKRRLEKIKASWEVQKGIKKIMLFLQEYSINPSLAAKIYKTYEDDSINVIKKNPFKLVDDIWGVGFKTADTIAQKLGFAKESYYRCRSGIVYVLNQMADNGHCFAFQASLIPKAAAMLEVDQEIIANTLSKMIKDEDLIPDDGDLVYLPPFFYAETNVANRIGKLIDSGGKSPLSLPCSIEDIGKGAGIEYDEVQVEAIRQAVESKVMVLTGCPGTGKTTVTKGIIEVLKQAKLDILLAAPTGRAAKRMSEATGVEAMTIHRLLEYSPRDGYGRNEHNPLEGGALIVDESSMIDIILMNSLIKAVPVTMRLILVGDIDQMPSVGAGNVLKDIIDSGVVPVVRLTKIFRQAQSSRIITNAHKINEGKFPVISNGKDTDFFFISDEDQDHAAEQIVDLVAKRLPKAYKVSPFDIQVLSPMKKGITGTGNLNTMLQAAINSSNPGLSRGGIEYRLGDRVMQVRNNYDKEVFNGDIGTIKAVDLEEETITVEFDGREVEYEAVDLNELVLSYAATIHKAQGSEFPIVIMPVSMSHYVMLQRNLVYTGITRAKQILVIVGTKKALAYAIRNVVITKRNSRLCARLKGECPAKAVNTV